MDNRENKNELIHIRIEPSIKDKSEDIFKRLGINMSYAVSLFLNQVILKNGFPFAVELPKRNENEIETLARIIENTGNIKFELDVTHCDEMDRVSEFNKVFSKVNTYDNPLVWQLFKLYR